MSTPEDLQGGLGVANILRETIGPEFDFYRERLQELEPSKFAVIKVGGATVEKDLDALTTDIAMLAGLGLYPVIVHGGGPQINADLDARDIKPKMYDGVRITDEETLSSVERGLVTVNQTLVDALAAKGVKAEGITSGVFEAHPWDEIATAKKAARAV